MSLVKAVIGPWRVEVKKVYREESWRVVVEVDAGHRVRRRTDYYTSLEEAEAAAEKHRQNLRRGLIWEAWARTIAREKQEIERVKADWERSNAMQKRAEEKEEH